MSRGDRALGIVLGLLLGVAIVAVFAFVFSEDTIDSAQLEGAGDGRAAEQPGDETDAGRGQPPGDPAEPPEPAVPVIEIEGGQPVGGVQELEVTSGESIGIRVSSDAAYEIHLHGYDVAQEVAAGGSTEFDVPADIEGVFELEIEETVTPIAEISVVPG